MLRMRVQEQKLAVARAQAFVEQVFKPLNGNLDDVKLKWLEFCQTQVMKAGLLEGYNDLEGGRPPLSFPDRGRGLFVDREFRGRTRTRAGWRAITTEAAWGCPGSSNPGRGGLRAPRSFDGPYLAQLR
jgi:hypothetical protein